MYCAIAKHAFSSESINGSLPAEKSVGGRGGGLRAAPLSNKGVLEEPYKCTTSIHPASMFMDL